MTSVSGEAPPDPEEGPEFTSSVLVSNLRFFASSFSTALASALRFLSTSEMIWRSTAARIFTAALISSIDRVSSGLGGCRMAVRSSRWVMPRSTSVVVWLLMASACSSRYFFFPFLFSRKNS